MGLEFLGYTIDFTFWQDFLNWTLGAQARALYAIIGWPLLILFFFKAGAELWLEYQQNKYMKQWQWVVLAVDIPPMFIQTPKAIEQIFAHLSGAATRITVADKFWKGKKQKWFSFEVISIEGYIQFLIRTEAEFRDLVEAAIYAQYTEAEITEVEDYVDIPDYYPNNEYDIMGVEFKLAQEEAYPIRTYPHFEYNISKEAVFSDPMAAMLENFTRIGHGENFWMQLIVEPTGSEWKEKGIELAKKLMGEAEAPRRGGLLPLIGGIPEAVMKELLKALNWWAEGQEAGAKAEKPLKKELSPGTKKIIEAVEDKISKIGFKSKLRALYVARKEVYNPTHCLEGFVGAVNQFHMQDRNALVPALATHVYYDRRHRKSNRLKNIFVKVFKKRKLKLKNVGGYILNIEELATVWHFPLPFVKTPLLQRAGAKRAEPPAGLPIEFREGPLKRKPVLPPTLEAPQAAPPDELPYA